MELIEFLLARIAEDEAVAHGSTSGVRVLTDNRPAFGRPDRTPGAMPGVVLSVDRVLTECSGKRQIVDNYWVPTLNDLDAGDEYQPVPFWTLKVLAMPYADHPDFDPAWRP